MGDFLTIPDLPMGRLTSAPGEAVPVALDGHACRASIAIPDSGERIARHYPGLMSNGVRAKARAAAVPDPLAHFGLVFHFDRPTLINLYDDELVLAPDVKRLIDQFGPVIFRNAYLPDKCRAGGQRNIFPDLDFHFDRSPLQPNKYSLFCRDPFDPVQRMPRESSTLIIPSLVAFLQYVDEGNPPEKASRALYPIFKKTPIDPLVGDILLELPWREPEGTGEICVFDNLNIFHASYYRTAKGYPIGVRYLF